MRVGEICNRNVVVVEDTASVVDAARLMRQHNVGDVLVVKELNQPQVPMGIITDRDIAVHVVADEVDPETIAVKDAMSFELVTASENDGVVETITLFRE
ncbi:MAG: CBS domain-containing protein, partial [Gammaproteobacteria bacterium]|nr:CBS domain-containing protein [Gammaproteobacteria bacterium]